MISPYLSLRTYLRTLRFFGFFPFYFNNDVTEFRTAWLLVPVTIALLAYPMVLLVWHFYTLPTEIQNKSIVAMFSIGLGQTDVLANMLLILTSNIAVALTFYVSVLHIPKALETFAGSFDGLHIDISQRVVFRTSCSNFMFVWIVSISLGLCVTAQAFSLLTLNTIPDPLDEAIIAFLCATAIANIEFFPFQIFLNVLSGQGMAFLGLVADSITELASSSTAPVITSTDTKSIKVVSAVTKSSKLEMEKVISDSLKLSQLLVSFEKAFGSFIVLEVMLSLFLGTIGTFMTLVYPSALFQGAGNTPLLCFSLRYFFLVCGTQARVWSLFVKGRSLNRKVRALSFALDDFHVQNGGCFSVKDSRRIELARRRLSENSPIRPRDLFDFTVSTLMSVFGLILTYLIVCAQFKVAETTTIQNAVSFNLTGNA